MQKNKPEKAPDRSTESDLTQNAVIFPEKAEPDDHDTNASPSEDLSVLTAGNNLVHEINFPVSPEKTEPDDHDTNAFPSEDLSVPTADNNGVHENNHPWTLSFLLETLRKWIPFRSSSVMKQGQPPFSSLPFSPPENTDGSFPEESAADKTSFRNDEMPAFHRGGFAGGEKSIYPEEQIREIIRNSGQINDALTRMQETITEIRKDLTT